MNHGQQMAARLQAAALLLNGAASALGARPAARARGAVADAEIALVLVNEAVRQARSRAAR